MGRSFVLTDIVDPVKAPITKRSLEHINNAINDSSSEIIKGLIGSYTTGDLIILRGCVVTANIPGTSSVTAGAIYYNGEVYQVDANASISSPSATLVWSVATTYISGDPATFSDGVSHNFHAIKKMQLTNAGTGTGLADYNAATVKYLDSIGNADDVFVDSTSIASTNNYFTATAFLVAMKSGQYIDLAGVLSIAITDAAGLNGTTSAEDVIFDLNTKYQFSSDAGVYHGCGIGHRVGVYSLAADIQQGASATKFRVRITKGPGTSVNAHTIDVAFSARYKGVF
jgi:hypothetical protein